MKKYSDIYEYVIAEENAFSNPISIEGWDWNMKDHLKRSFYYKHGRLLEGNDPTIPVKNITRPIINLQYRAEDIDVKDITLYVDDEQFYHLSFLVKKYHDDIFIQENNLDEFIDDAKESKIDYGLGLAKYVGGPKPDVINLQSIAFCDQTNVLKGPIGLKYFFNPAELKDMAKQGWGEERNGATISIDDLILMSENYIVQDRQDGVQNLTPGGYIEIYEVHGVLPKHFLTDSRDDTGEYERQFQIIAFYKDQKGMKQGVTLFKKRETKNRIKAIERDKVFGRACGYGGIEELFEPQVWTNYGEIRKKDLLDSASKTILKAIGASLRSRYPNGLKDMDNLQIIELNEGEDVGQIDTTPRSIGLFNESINEWQNYAQQMGSATDPLLGEEAPSGTPFRSQERQVMEGKGIHNYRKGKYAKWLEEVYRDWIIPHIVEKITQGTKFLSELSVDEMRFVGKKMAENEAAKMVRERILNGQDVTPEMEQQFKDEVMRKFVEGGNKKFIEILKGEFNKKPVRVKINVAGKQKDISLMADKLTNIFRQIIANPQGFQQAMQIPEVAKTFNDILEYSGLSPAYYAFTTSPQIQQPQPINQPNPITA